MKRLLLTTLLLAHAGVATADLEFVSKGIDDPLRANVLAYVDVLQLGRRARVGSRDLQQILDEAIVEARLALRPYGYYRPEISGRYLRPRDADPVLELTIRPGPAIRITAVDVVVEGEGATSRELRAWRDDWPLGIGLRLDQTVWKRQKQAGLEVAASIGYLGARYTTQTLALDLEQNTASLKLVLDTGRRYVIGTIDYGEHVLQPHVVENIPRFVSGDPYSSRLVDTFRQDLWQTGYFTDVEVVETRRPDTEPPSVDLNLRLETTTKNRYLGAIGFGTDTGIRLQASWTRQPMSSRGDRVEIGLGWQEFEEEFTLRGNYRLPRSSRARQYWTADVTIKSENQDLEFKRRDEDESFIKLANGNVDERHVRFGQLRIRNRKAGDQQLSLTPFVQYLNSERRFQPLEPQPVVIGGGGDEAFGRLLIRTDNAFSVGVDLDVVSLRGKAFETRGRRDRAWLFTSNSAFGSEVDFTQLYVSSRRSFVRGERFKLLLRGEIGYTKADVDEVLVDVDGTTLDLSVTRLPNFYRFRAGGSSSVRGYDFEQLSNNNVGSNHIITGSAEIEYRFANTWSAALFADIGNAFNDWSDRELKLGVGVGIRWYSIAGPIRIDIAQARDFEGKPWRLHFTIGSPLL